MNSLYIFSSTAQAFIFSNQIVSVKKSYLIVIGNTKQRECVMAYLAKYKWLEIYEFNDISGNNAVFRIWNLVKLRLDVSKLFTQKNIANLFIGSINNYVQLIFLNLYNNRGSVHLMTDGMQQIVINEFRNDKREILRELPKIFGYIGIKNRKIDKINFLTPYRLKSKYDAVDYIPFKKREILNFDDNILAFIGMPVVELNMISIEAHLNNLRKVKKKFPKKELYYFAHPSEKKENLIYINERYKVVTLSKIFEEYLQEPKNVPRSIISYYSSVLLNSHLLYNQMRIYFIELSSDRKDLSENTQALYRYFKEIESESFKGIHL